MEIQTSLFRLTPADNVAVAMMDVPKGTQVEIDGTCYTAADDIPFGHKMALSRIAEGDVVVKYGHCIGYAVRSIQPGQWVHVHNVKTSLEGKVVFDYNPTQTEIPQPSAAKDTFQGYRRQDGTVGIRNEIWIIPTVSCVNHTVSLLAQEAQKRFGHLCDGIHAFPHNSGCSQLGADHKITQDILASIIRHPNAGGALVVSLGCENNNLENFRPVLKDVDDSRIKFMVAQDVEDELEAGLRLIGAIAQTISVDKRETVPARELKIAFKCGGSDAFSGVTANPLCGRIADRVTALGGTGILTEVPEMFGAENILMNRADSPQTFQKIVQLIDSFKQYYLDYNQPIYENPSPGNKSGGITTLEEKSLGCTQKGGNAMVTDTLTYGQRASKPGINLMTGPGNDSVSITNLVAAGAQILLFTTGRGNPLGTAIPAVKISSNGKLYESKSNWIDYNAGDFLYGTPMEELCDGLWNLILDVASGKKQTKNETNGYREIMIFKNGVML